MDRAESLRTWEWVAPAWERHRDRIFTETRAISERLVEAVAPAPGKTILELTAGTGETSFLVATHGCAVICTDAAPSMVAAARRGASARGLSDVDCRVMDATTLELADDSVDGVICRYGLMLIPDQQRVVEEVRRVLRPDGTFAYAVWGPLEKNVWIVVLGGALAASGHLPPMEPFTPGGMFSLADPGTNESLLKAAGFDEVSIETLTTSQNYGSFDDLWGIQRDIAGPIAQIIQGLDPDQVAAVRDIAERSAAAFLEPDGRYIFPSTTILVRAR